MSLRALLIALAIVACAGCGGGNPPASPSSSAGASQSGSPLPSSRASGSPGATVDEAFCGTVTDLDGKLGSFEAIKLKASNKSKIKPAADNVAGALSAVQTAAAPALKTKVDALKAAVDSLVSASENYSTSPHPDTVAGVVKNAVKALHTAITKLRAASNCTG